MNSFKSPSVEWLNEPLSLPYDIREQQCTAYMGISKIPFNVLLLSSCSAAHHLSHLRAFAKSRWLYFVFQMNKYNKKIHSLISSPSSCIVHPPPYICYETVGQMVLTKSFFFLFASKPTRIQFINIYLYFAIRHLKEKCEKFLHTFAQHNCVLVVWWFVCLQNNANA